MRFAYAWGMPSTDTFDCPPIADFVSRWAQEAPGPSIDPFARNRQIATVTNDINPSTSAQFHMDAEAFIAQQADAAFNLAIMDPPYSPRQISESYAAAGLKASQQDTQNARLYSRTRAALRRVMAADAVVLSFGWNSGGMGKKHGAVKLELLLVAHGGAHNDTICLAERLPRIT